MSVFDSVIGQEAAVSEFLRASQDANAVQSGDHSNAMTHAWLVTGPPGSGRSTLALAFAATLVCSKGGCGSCADCRSVTTDTHPDVEHVIPEALIYTVDNADALIERAAMAPRRSQWHVIVIEDVDRFQMHAIPKLLRAIEEPPPQTVWVLCSPTVEDVLPTVRSRCRHVLLNSPSLEMVATQLENRFGVAHDMAAFASRVAQGHIGRARALATDESVRLRRSEILDIPSQLTTVSACFSAATRVINAINSDTDELIAPMDLADEDNVRMVFGDGASGFKSIDRAIKREVKLMEDRFKSRRRRVLFDQFDRICLDLTGFYRDVLAVQVGSDAELINSELRPQIEKLAAIGTVTDTIGRIDAIKQARDQLYANVTPLLVFESLFVGLRDARLLVAG